MDKVCIKCDREIKQSNISCNIDVAYRNDKYWFYLYMYLFI